MEEVKLISIGKLAKRLKNRTLSLNRNDKEFVLGRNRDAQCMILDVNVSRRHASFKYVGEYWTVTDNKVPFKKVTQLLLLSKNSLTFQSTNGIYVNQRKVPPEIPAKIQHGDRIGLGNDGNYEWKFQIMTLDAQNNAVNDLVEVNLKKTLDRFMKEKADLETRVDDEKKAQEKLRQEKQTLARELEEKRIEFEAKQKAENECFEKKLFESKEINENEKQELAKRLEDERQAFNIKHLELQSELSVKIEESQDKMAKLEAEKVASIEKLQKEKEKMEENLLSERAKFAEKLQQLKQENQTLNLQKVQELEQEFCAKLQKTQAEFEAAVQLEKNEREEERQKLAEKLQQEKVKFQLKEEENQQLKAKLQGVEMSNLQTMKENLLRNCANELKCSICDELFIMPMTLNCGHVFCQYCIKQWESKCIKKTDFTCPNCRQSILTFTRAMHLENLIDAVYRETDENLAKERQQLIQERKMEMEKAENEAKNQTKKGKKKAAPPRRTGTMRDFVQQPTGGSAAASTSTVPLSLVAAPPPLVSSVVPSVQNEVTVVTTE